MMRSKPMRHHRTLIGMAKATEEQQELSLAAGGNAKWDKNHTHILLFVFAKT